MTILTFKTPEKSPSENVICLSCLLQIFDDIIIPPQTLFVVGILFSRCPCVRASVRASVRPSVRNALLL